MGATHNGAMNTTRTPLKALTPGDVFWFSAQPEARYRAVLARSGAGQTTVDYVVEGSDSRLASTFTKPSLTYVVVAG